jgi:hypothetical protein
VFSTAKATLRLIFLALCCLLVSAGSAAAQRTLDEWPVRGSAGPDAVGRGVEAVFWNPAAITTRAYRGEAFVADQRTPDEIGVRGFAVAGAWRLDARTTVGAAYQHLGIDDIGETSESPLPDPGVPPTFSIGEDQIHVGAAHVLSKDLTVGAGVRLDKSNESWSSGADSTSTSLTAGLLIRPAFLARIDPSVGGSMIFRQGGLRWTGGVDFALPLSGALQTRFGYGVRGGDGLVDLEHRLGLGLSWRRLVAASLGATAGSSGAGRKWEPTIGATLRLSRYELGVLREALANDFGAAYSFRLRLGID